MGGTKFLKRRGPFVHRNGRRKRQINKGEYGFNQTRLRMTPCSPDVGNTYVHHIWHGTRTSHATARHLTERRGWCIALRWSSTASRLAMSNPTARDSASRLGLPRLGESARLAMSNLTARDRRVGSARPGLASRRAMNAHECSHGAGLGNSRAKLTELRAVELHLYG